MSKVEAEKRRVGKEAQVIYSCGDRIYLDIPKNMVVIDCYYDEKEGVYYGILRTKVHIVCKIFLVLSICAFLGSIGYYFFKPKTEQVINYDATVLVHDDYLAVNVVNQKMNTEDITFQIVDMNGIPYTEEVCVPVGQSVGNVRVVEDTIVRYGGATLRIYVGDSKREYRYTVILVPIEEDK